jgi:hypothetical protein
MSPAKTTSAIHPDPFCDKPVFMTFINPNQPALILAPMEGAMDAPMRALIADIGGFDYAVSEFIEWAKKSFVLSRSCATSPI